MGTGTKKPAPEVHRVGDYLEAIFEMVEEGVRVQQARIAERLGVSRASVSEQVRRMKERGLVTVSGRDIAFTAKGRAVAEDAVRRHRMAERFLVDVLKMPWSKAHEAAQDFQSGIAGAVEERILEMLGGPATCPHGNPIPGTGAEMPTDTVALNTVEPGQTVELVRLTEDVELDGEAMIYFEEHGLMPGAAIKVVSVGPDGTMTLAVGKTRASLGAALADNLWVRPARPRGTRARRA